MTAFSDDALAKWMSEADVIASVGVTSDPATDAYRSASYQQSQGYRVIPVNHSGDIVLGQPSVASVAQIAEPVDIVNVCVPVRDGRSVTDDAIRAGAKVLWLEPGTEDNEIVRRARSSGMHVVSNRNFEREHRRLLSGRPH